MKNLAVVIPIYKADLRNNERIALCQVIKKLGGYDIYFIAPDGLLLNEEFAKVNYKYFEKDCFASIASYSGLMLQERFYREFVEYEYILIYQLDAFVFSSDIMYFLELGYDYIGAPSLEGMYKPYRDEKVLYTQNGGLSLRKISSFIKWTRNNIEEISLMNKYDAEDSIIYALRNKGLVLAPIDIALEFSFDSNVHECICRTNGKLPFGCHAWERYDYEFWKEFIEREGYSVSEVDISKRIVKDYYNIELYNKRWEERYNSKILTNILGRRLRKFDNKVYVWGMGKHGYDAMQLLLGAGVEIIAYTDSDENKVSKGMYPCKGISVEEVTNSKSSIPIVVALYNHVDVCILLEKCGFHHNEDYITYMELFQEFEIETMK